jgi:hypothetical protein
VPEKGEYLKKFFLCAASLLCAFSLILLTHTPVHALTISWSGSPIMGGEDPSFLPQGEAVFTIVDNSTLTLELTYTGSEGALTGVSQVLTGLTWDLVNFLGTLSADSAVIAPGSVQVGANAGSQDDLSGQWAYKGGINVPSIPLGAFGVGAIGDINYGDDTFGSGDIIDGNKTFQTPAPNGIGFGLVPLNTDGVPFTLDSLPPSQSSNPDGFKNQGPVVQNSMVFTFAYTGGLTESMFANVRPLYGSEGATIPEPAAILLIGVGLIGVAVVGRRLSKKT